MSSSSSGIDVGGDGFAGELEHVTVEEDDFSVCTMYPVDCTEVELATRWIVAGSGSFVALEDAR